MSSTANMMRRMPSVFTGASSGPALTAVGVWNLSSSIRPWPSGVRIIAMSLRTPSSPTTRSTDCPSTVASPSSSRPSSAKNAIAALRSSTTMRTLSIRRSVMSPEPPRLGWPRRGNWIGVAVHDLPHAVFGAKDTCYSQSDCHDLRTPGDPRLVALYFHDVSEFGSHVFGYALESGGFAVSVVRGGTLHRRRRFLPATYGRAKGIREANVVSMRVNALQGLGVSLHELSQCFV